MWSITSPFTTFYFVILLTCKVTSGLLIIAIKCKLVYSIQFLFVLENFREIRECLKLDPDHKECFPFYKVCTYTNFF